MAIQEDLDRQNEAKGRKEAFLVAVMVGIISLVLI